MNLDDLDEDDVRVAGKVAQTAFSDIVNSLVDVHSAVVVLAITGALEVGALAMLIVAREQVVASFSAQGSTTYIWAYPAAIGTGFFLSLGVCTLISKRTSFVSWLISMAFGFLNGCILFVLTT